jgi:hypothetical protein
MVRALRCVAVLKGSVYLMSEHTGAVVNDNPGW